MFYFLVLTGSALILFGFYSRKRQMTGPEPVLQAVKPKVQEDAADPGVEALHLRMDQLEKLIFQSLMVREVRKAEAGASGREAAGGSEGQLPGDSAGEGPSDLMGEVPEVGSGILQVPSEAVPEGKVSFTSGCPSPAMSPAAAAHEEGFTPMASGSLEGTGREEVPKRKPMPDNIRAIADYEKQGMSVQEIANVTRMKKGEVLLLKNLSKHYSR